MTHTQDFGSECKKRDFLIDPNHTFLNHGSWGAVPKKVMDNRIRQQYELESNSDHFMRRLAPVRWEENVQAAADFLKCDRANITLVPNATSGINSVMKSWPFKPEDGLLVNSWTYNAVQNICHSAITRAGGELLTLQMKLPIESTQQIVDIYDDFFKKHPNIKVVVLDVISSATAIKWPFEDLVRICKQHNVLVMADGAHTPGQLPINLADYEEMGVDFYTGVFHKWVYCPRGCGALWVNPKHKGIIRPAITSHFYQKELFSDDFFTQGTMDLTPYFVLKDAIAFYNEKGGMDIIPSHNSSLLDEAVALLLSKWGTRIFPVPPHFEPPNMRLVRLPDLPKFPIPEKLKNKPFGDANDVMTELHARGVTVPTLCVEGEIWVRLSAQIYNCIEDYHVLADVVSKMMSETA